jgi:hypothetical protein
MNDNDTIVARKNIVCKDGRKNNARAIRFERGVRQKSLKSWQMTPRLSNPQIRLNP